MALREILYTHFFSRRPPIPPLLAVSAGPVLLALFVLLGPFLTDPFITHSGLGVRVDGALLRGVPTIDPNIAITSFALGLRAALDVISGQMPLWNHFQGFGTPLLGEMQSAALFPPTLLLLLPGGQALEHIFLQWVAGVGAYLFFRKFGLGGTASVIGAVLYEFNGVFATLRNAAFNPVAFLPWLLFGVEVLRANAMAARPMGRRTAAIALTAIAGALALYAGFPETAYLYGLFVVAWSVFRMMGLAARQTGTFFLDLVLAVGLALLLSAPLLVAFVTFLAEADIGGHGTDFMGGVQEKETAILYLFPYLYGLFVAAPDPGLAGLSISSGGYIALAPVILAAASLCLPGYRSVKILLCGWLVIALGASHGWPLIHPAFSALPLMDLAVPGRYLNASWIFCAIFLAALAVDRIADLEPRQRRRAALGAFLGTVALATAAAMPAAEMIPRAWQSVRPAFVASICAGALAVLFSLIALRATSRRLRAIALGAVVLEAAALFLLPFLAYPRSGSIDRAAIAFLRENTGFQRVAKTEGVGLGANFGAAIGVGLLHFDDLPSPRRTIAYLRTRVDPYVDRVFVPESPALAGKELEERRRAFRDGLANYAAAGVKYVMAAPDFYADPAFAFVHRDERPIILGENQGFAIEAESTSTTAVDALTVRVATFRNSSTGSIAARLCVNDTCGRGESDIATADDGKLLLIRLDAPVTLEAGAPYRLEFQKHGLGPGAIWSYPKPEGAPEMRVVEAPGKVEAGYSIDLGFIAVSRPKPVYASRSMAFYALENVRPYAAAPDCEIILQSRDDMETTCSRPSRLTRLNVHMNGWRARVNGTDVPIGLADDTFQTVDVPQGKARLSFRYSPPGLALAFAAAAAGLVLVVGIFVLPAARRKLIAG